MSTISRANGDIIINLTQRDRAYIIARFEGTKVKRILYTDSGNDGNLVTDEWVSCPEVGDDDHLPPNLYQVERFTRSSRDDRTIVLQPRYQNEGCAQINPTLTFSSIQETSHVDALPKTTVAGTPLYRISQWDLTIGGQPGERVVIIVVMQDDDFGKSG